MILFSLVFASPTSITFVSLATPGFAHDAHSASLLVIMITIPGTTRMSDTNRDVSHVTMHTHTHTHTHTYTHSHSHAHAHTRTYANVKVRTRATNGTRTQADLPSVSSVQACGHEQLASNSHGNSKVRTPVHSPTTPSPCCLAQSLSCCGCHFLVAAVTFL